MGAAPRVALWRTELARRRVLVVLDNGASSEQVAELLPTAPGMLALGDQPPPAGRTALTEGEAVTLLTRRIFAEIQVPERARASGGRRDRSVARINCGRSRTGGRW